MVLIIYLFFDYEILYFIFFTIIGIAGIFNKMLLSLLLLDIFWRFPMLSKVANVLIIYSNIGNLVTKKSYHIGYDIIHDFLILLCNSNILVSLNRILSIMLGFIAMFFFSCRHVFKSEWRDSWRFALNLLE